MLPATDSDAELATLNLALPVRVCSICHQEFSDGVFCPFDGTHLVDKPQVDAHPTTALSSDRFEIGAIVGENYQIESVLGEGGMGIVYRALHVKLQRRFAI